MGIVKVLTLSLVLATPAFGQVAPPLDPADLLQQAKEMLVPGQSLASEKLLGKVAPILRQANAIWEASSSTASKYAESLDLLAMILRSGGMPTEQWTKEAAPLIAQALKIREGESNEAPSADLALALELQADVLAYKGDGTGAGAPFWDRASKIRGQLVSEIEYRARPPLQPPAGPVFLVSKAQGISPPSLLKQVDPKYSATARIAKYNCTVVVKVVVNADGMPENITLRRGCGFGLDEAAAEALVQWRFQPATKDFQTVAVSATLSVNFKLL